jgi:lipopolysaccharide transport system ATP-binding protein
MSNVAIRIENLGKRYKIGVKREKYYTLRDSLMKALTYPFRGRRQGRPDRGHPQEDFIWALKDVSLEINHGDIIGIIGRNGAGKSTLLKILSRITEPTEGQAEIFGRVGSLLEVGTGFHPELTGRENIFLNGVIMGMTRAEVQRNFDAIVAFAEIEKFLETPVKHYSSGMYVRLAFAVAAHLDPEILLVDEVLAVGDAVFQKKCLGKMEDVAKGGRTVLFVSHNMSAVKQLCPRSIMLDSGKLFCNGDSESVIEGYLQSSSTISATLEVTESLKRSGTGTGRIEKVELENQYGQQISTIGVGDALIVKIYARLFYKMPSLVGGIEVKSQNGVHLLNLRSDSLGKTFGPYNHGDTVLFFFKIPSMPFFPGIYIIEPWFAKSKGKRVDHLQGGINIMIEPKGNFKSEMLIQKGKGLVIMDFECSDMLVED